MQADECVLHWPFGDQPALPTTVSGMIREATTMLDVRPFGAGNLPDLEQLFSSEKSAEGCWCMWFVIAVKEYHQGGSAANAAKFKALAASSAHPLGVIAYNDGRPVGWAAAGPRSRYARAVRTPTMKGIDQSQNDNVWLVPCFFIRPDMRGQRLARSCSRAPSSWRRNPAPRRSRAFNCRFQAGERRPSGRDRARVRELRLRARQPTLVQPRSDAAGFLRVLAGPLRKTSPPNRAARGCHSAGTSASRDRRAGRSMCAQAGRSKRNLP